MKGTKMNDYIASLKATLKSLKKNGEGDISFIQPPKEDYLLNFEKSINWKLPEVFRYFLHTRNYGLIIDDKRIYSLYDEDQKKTWVENLQNE